ncbi:uncharacterized protein LOC132062366 [Lycium ferocissimum]|uniref:uncharacterized protein LOC132062366 n=1 Tax=Lycium ferocissimum TaxID=112874 RepID=UPI0028158D0E|nr:uncharacterized protein LOC132062366 [Lycium ferocissimum]
MENLIIYIELELKEEKYFRVINCCQRICYNELVEVICQRCKITCDPGNISLSYKPMILDKTWQETPYVPLEDDFDLKSYFMIVDERGARPTLKVCLLEDGKRIEKTSAVSCESGEIQVLVGSNGCNVIQEHYSPIFVEEEQPVDNFADLHLEQNMIQEHYSPIFVEEEEEQPIDKFAECQLEQNVTSAYQVVGDETVHTEGGYHMADVA